MPKFVIVKKEDLSIVGSYIADQKDDTSENRSYLQAEPICAHIEVPEETDVEVLLASVLDDEIVVSEDAGLVSAKALKAKEVLIAAAYEDMNGDVLTQMTAVFGTSKPESATAYKETWDLMSASPSDWTGAGLKAAFAVGGLIIGDALDTDQKVKDYADAKLAEVKAYGIWRMQRIEQFKEERDAILAQ